MLLFLKSTKFDVHNNVLLLNDIKQNLFIYICNMKILCSQLIINFCLYKSQHMRLILRKLIKI